MAPKRYLDEPAGYLDSDHSKDQKRMIRSRPSFASVIGEAVMVNSIKKFCLALEPMVRRVVSEEVESSLRSSSSQLPNLSRSPSLRMQAAGEPSSLQLMFTQNLLLPIFTGSKIVDVNSSPIQILLVDTTRGTHDTYHHHHHHHHLPHPLKIEVVVLDGDFPSNSNGISSGWSSEEFDDHIVKERRGKRPLLAGDCLTVTLRDGFATIGEIEFTDNSSWIRSRKFRIGARLAPGIRSGFRIREAISQAFVVKDHRGELYKKHHPPKLEDEVWRLEKIGKDGAFHSKLTVERINTVQDFLKLSVIDPQKLRRILGPGMSEKMWEVTIKHARTCDLGNKHYIYRRPNCEITLNPICQIVHAMIDGNSYSTKELSSSRGYIETLVRHAYANWNSLEEVVGVPRDMHSLTQGESVDQYPNHRQGIVKSIQQVRYPTDRYIETASPPSNAHFEYNKWQITPAYHGNSTVEPDHDINFSISESSSDGEITPNSYINGN